VAGSSKQGNVSLGSVKDLDSWVRVSHEIIYNASTLKLVQQIAVKYVKPNNMSYVY
jgi:hypothetical protein